jgi:hypothetical protein
MLFCTLLAIHPCQLDGICPCPCCAKCSQDPQYFVAYLCQMMATFQQGVAPHAPAKVDAVESVVLWAVVGIPLPVVLLVQVLLAVAVVLLLAAVESNCCRPRCHHLCLFLSGSPYHHSCYHDWHHSQFLCCPHHHILHVQGLGHDAVAVADSVAVVAAGAAGTVVVVRDGPAFAAALGVLICSSDRGWSDVQLASHASFPAVSGSLPLHDFLAQHSVLQWLQTLDLFFCVKPHSMSCLQY